MPSKDDFHNIESKKNTDPLTGIDVTSRINHWVDNQTKDLHGLGAGYVQQQPASEMLIDSLVMLNPHEFTDEFFIQATQSLSSKDFTRATYKVYLRREPEHLILPHIDEGINARAQFLERVRESPEYRFLWVSRKKKRNLLFPFLYLPNKLATNILIIVLSSFSPFRLSDRCFARLTYVLDGKSFVRVAYLTYLKREPDRLITIGKEVAQRMQLLSDIRHSSEFIRYWNLS
ncbi:hypothetical protein [Pseudanabaena sp. PCC 6802]|uniref:hypothetical protein n=1 Tax=Pseudanabaena sp. PCC 6802 TaxID=118173 RepID=UPI00034CBC0E|nr:hypothetical protein [Pseudanabaena sp. PCC 6802]